MSAVLPNSTVNSTSRGSAMRPLVQVWQWWRGELRAIFRPLLDKYWVDSAQTITLALDADNVIPANARVAGRDVRILLPVASVLQKQVVYPAAVEENLIEVLGNDIDRQTPFTADQVYIAHRMMRRFNVDGDEGARIELTLMLVLRRAVDRAIETVRASGGRVVSLGMVGDTAQIELLPQSARPARRLSQLQKLNLGLLVMLALLMLAAIATPIILKRLEVKQLAPLVDKARSEAEATRKIEAEFQRLQQEYQTAVSKKYAAYQAVDIVEELTKLSPDTTWLLNFEMKAAPAGSKINGKVPAREIQLMGEAPSAAKMIELIEQSTYLQNTTQRAQTTRGTAPGTERFQVTTEVKPRPAPPLQDLLTDDAAAANVAPAVIAPPAPAPVTATVSVTPAPGKDAGKEVGKDSGKDATKDAIKGAAKDAAKDAVKDAVKDAAKPAVKPATVATTPANQAQQPSYSTPQSNGNKPNPATTNVVPPAPPTMPPALTIPTTPPTSSQQTGKVAPKPQVRA